uniref:Transcriptional regulator n=1 Tax=Parastrongyloides trichosuri TaxID=131310 RepID=A0A0N4ZC77_PARTI
MFDLTDTQHVIMSLILHFVGINFGIWCWYLFPKNPHRQVNRNANRIVVEAIKKNKNDEEELLIESPSKDLFYNRYQG